MGEADEPKKSVLAQASEDAMVADTMGGRMHVRWDETAQATPHGQIVFFAEFLATAGVFDRWVQACPLRYSSPNASSARDVLGTLMLGILAGSKRYAHIAGVRGDAVAAKALGLDGMVSEDSVRRALKAMDPQASEPWMRQALMASVRDALDRPWVLDLDATIKPLYGHQEGAEVGYNPHKPGRPSHAIHTYWISNLRLVLDAQLEPGDRHSPVYARPGLVELLQSLPEAQRPKLVRGDSAFGSEGEMSALEALGQPYLFKLRQTAGVKALVQRQWARRDWCELGQGWQGCEAVLRLTGWSQSRRVIVMRRERRTDLLVEVKRKARGKRNEQAQTELCFIDENAPVKSWEYAVLVCNTSYTLPSIGQLYRDRADCENGFDEIKNQWGWGGYSTHDIERCALSAQAVALIYNWWSWYVRLAQPKKRLEAITSRPKLLSAVGRMTNSNRQTKILLTITHEAVSEIKQLVTNVRNGIEHVRANAPQLPGRERWFAMVRYIVERILGCAPRPNLGIAAFLTG